MDILRVLAYRGYIFYYNVLCSQEMGLDVTECFELIMEKLFKLKCNDTLFKESSKQKNKYVMGILNVTILFVEHSVQILQTFCSHMCTVHV